MGSIGRLSRGVVVASMVCLVTLPALAQPPGNRQRLPEGVKVLREFEYAKIGEKSLLLDLYLPETFDGKLPVIVSVHGGGWANGSKAGSQGIWLAGRGYAVASVGYHLSGEAIFPAQIEDCKAAVRWLRANAEKYHLDAERFGAIGHSAGGHLVSMLGTTGPTKEFDTGDHLEFSSQVQAVCPLSGPTDFLQMDAHANPFSRFNHNSPNSPESRLIGAPITENPDKVAKANPITYVSEKSPPFLIIHGEADPVVPPHQAQILHEALQKVKVESTLNIVKGAEHGVGGREINDQILVFFDRVLKGKG